MTDCFLILFHLLTAAIFAFEVESLHVGFHDSVHLSPVDGLIAATLFGAALIDVLPGIDAVVAENRLALAAFQRIEDDVRADLTDEEVSTLLFF